MSRLSGVLAAIGPSSMLPVGITGASPRVTVVAAAEAGTAIDRPVTTRSDRLSSAALPERSRLLQWCLGQLLLACTERPSFEVLISPPQFSTLYWRHALRLQ